MSGIYKELIQKPTPDHMVGWRAQKLREAELGALDVHLFSHDGEPFLEVTVNCGTSISEDCIAQLGQARDADGNPLTLTYEGVLSQDQCGLLADALEAEPYETINS